METFPRNWSFVPGIHQSPVNSPHKGQWRGALMFSLIYVWINDWVNNREAGEWRRFRAHYDIIVMFGPDNGIMRKNKVNTTVSEWLGDTSGKASDALPLASLSHQQSCYWNKEIPQTYCCQWIIKVYKYVLCFLKYLQQDKFDKRYNKSIDKKVLAGW